MAKDTGAGGIIEEAEKVLENLEIDVIQELVWVIGLSKEHMARVVEFEQKSDMPLDGTVAALRLHAEILEIYQRLRFQLGLDRPADQAKLPIELTHKVDGPTLERILTECGLLIVKC